MNRLRDGRRSVKNAPKDAKRPFRCIEPAFASTAEIKKFQPHNTQMRSVKVGLALARCASALLQKSPTMVVEKSPIVSCILIVTAALLVGIAKCTGCAKFP